MCQPQPQTSPPKMINMFPSRASSASEGSCPTIKANARIRRSRQWRDQSENKSPNKQSSTQKNTRHNNGNMRRPRSDSNASTASMSMSSSSDDSLSNTSSCTPTTKSYTTPTKSSNRRRANRGSKKQSKSTTQRRPTKVVSIVVPELTPDEKARYLALDAEMVGIGPSGFTSRLARVSLVNYDGEVVYDTFVKVQEKVTDYRTFVSGITPQHLEGDDAVTFDDAQSRVMELIQGKILVGHGLKNDFNVLGITHPWYDIRDTAKYEPFMKTPSPYDYNPTNANYIPKKLQVLARDKLGMIIQEEGKPHCPIEDAVAALELYKKHSVKWEKVIKYKLDKTREIAASKMQ